MLTRRPPLFEWLFTGASMLVLGPGLLFIVVESRRALNELENTKQEQIAAAISGTARQVEYWYGRHFAVLSQAAQAARGHLGDHDLLQRECEQIRQYFPDFAAVYVAGSNATTLAFAPRAYAGRAKSGLDLSDRESFQRLAASRRAVISEAVLGRGPLTGAVQTISIPILEGGKLAAYVCGALNLESLEALVKSPRLGDVQITLLDEKDRVLAATRKEHRPLAPYAMLAAGTYSMARSNLYLRAPAARLPEMKRWAQSVYTRSARLDEPWPVTVAAEVPVAPVQHQLYGDYISNMLIGFLAFALAGLTAFVLSGALARPISRLAAMTSNFSFPIPPEKDWPVFFTDELATLAENFRRAFQALQNSFENLEEQVAERTRRLRRSIQELEAFSYSVSHDLRAPLRAMSGYADFLLEDLSPVLDETGRAYLRNIRASAAKMDRLINDLLEYARLSNAELPAQPVDPAPLLENILRTFSAEISRRGAEIINPGTFPRVLVNPVALEQILTNLIANALKFVPPEKNPRIEIQARSSNSKVILSIQDNGIGISPEHHEKIFGLFQRLHDESGFEGTGAGLAIVRKALERVGGRVWLESEPGRGSTFYFELPKHCN